MFTRSCTKQIDRLDGKTGRQTDRLTDKQTDGQTDRQTDRQKTDRQTDEWTDRQTDRQTDRWTDRRTDGQTGQTGQTDRYTSNCPTTDFHELSSLNACKNNVVEDFRTYSASYYSVALSPYCEQCFVIWSNAL